MRAVDGLAIKPDLNDESGPTAARVDGLFNQARGRARLVLNSV